MPNSKKSAETQRTKYGQDHFSRIGAKGGSKKVKKGLAVVLKRMTEEERAEFFRKRNEKRWGKKNADHAQ